VRSGRSNKGNSLQFTYFTVENNSLNTLNKPVGFYGPIASPVPNTPRSECSQFQMPPSFDRCTPPRHRFNQNILPSVVLLQQCHCWNRHRGKLQNLSPPAVLFESSQIVLQYTGDTDAKNDGPEFWNSNSVTFENFLKFSKGVARSLCGRSGPLWSRPN